MNSTKFGVILLSLVLVIGLGMYAFQGYSNISGLAGKSVSCRTNANCLSLGRGYTCVKNICVKPSSPVRPVSLPPPCTPSTEICDGIDNDCDSQLDEGCDDDNDDYCKSTMTRASPYSCSGSTNCCPLGGGDCYDLAVGYPSLLSRSINPGAQENCFNSYDDNCNGQQNENCEPYTCEDTDPTNDPYVGGTVAIVSANEQQRTAGGGIDSRSIPFSDSCLGDTTVNETMCFAYNEYVINAPGRAVPCPESTICQDPDDLTGPTPAICVPLAPVCIDSDSTDSANANDASYTIGGNVAIGGVTYSDRCDEGGLDLFENFCDNDIRREIDTSCEGLGTDYRCLTDDQGQAYCGL